MLTHSASAAQPAGQEEVDLGDDSEESDEYDEDFEEEEEADAEEEDEDDSEEEGDAEEGGGLTALLLGDGAADEDEEEGEYAGDANPNATHATTTTPGAGVKRPAEVEDDAASHEAGTKKAKTA